MSLVGVVLLGLASELLLLALVLVLVLVLGTASLDMIEFELIMNE